MIPKNNADKKNTLIKHSAAVHINNKISGVERKVYNILLKNAYADLKNKDEHTMKLNNLASEIGWNPDNFVPQHLKNSIVKLVETSIQWNILKKDKKGEWGVSALLASAEIKNGMVKYTYSNALKNLLSKPNVYTTLDLNYQKKLSTKFSLALWEFCCEQLDTNKTNMLQTKFIEISKLRELLGAEKDSYSIYKELNRYILKQAVQEINNITDLEISIITEKSERKVVAIAFNIVRKAVPIQSQLELFGDDLDAIELMKRRVEMESLENQGEKLNLTGEQVKKFLNSYEPNQVLNCFNLVIEKIKLGKKINNVTGYIRTLLDNGLGESQSSEEVKPNLLAIEEKNSKKEEEQIKQTIDKIIAAEEDYYKNTILKACKKAMHPKILLLALKEKNIILNKVERNHDNNIFIILKHTLRIRGYEEEVKKAAINEFKKQGIKVDIEIKR